MSRNFFNESSASASINFPSRIEITEKKAPKQVTIICDYKTSKDYDRLYKLLNDGQTVLVRSCVKKGVLAENFYNSFKSHRDNEYYICCGPTEYLPTKEKFIYYCKFKEIEFLDFIV